MEIAKRKRKEEEERKERVGKFYDRILEEIEG